MPFYLTRPTVHPGSKGNGASIGSPAVHFLRYTCIIFDCPQTRCQRDQRSSFMCKYGQHHLACAPFKENILLVHLRSVCVCVVHECVRALVHMCACVCVRVCLHTSCALQSICDGQRQRYFLGDAFHHPLCSLRWLSCFSCCVVCSRKAGYGLSGR